jgi:hypothetical protein
MAPEKIPMIVPPYVEKHGRPHTITLANETLRMSKEVRVILGQFYLYIAIARDRSLREAIAKAKADQGLAITEGALLRMLVIGIAAIFDKDEKTSGLQKLVRNSLKSAAVDDLNAFHAHCGFEDRARRVKEQLIRIQRRLKSGAFSRAIKNLTTVRNTVVAHFDANPDPVSPEGRALLKDVDRAMAIASSLVIASNFWVLGRMVDVAGARALMRADAAQLTGLLRRGADTSAG